MIISDSASDFNNTALLTPENMREVLDLTFPYRAKWRRIGIQLGIDIGKIDAIEANRRMVEDCLTDLISHWLRNTKPKPTRGALTAVLQSEHVSGNNIVIIHGKTQHMHGIIKITIAQITKFRKIVAYTYKQAFTVLYGAHCNCQND